MHIEKNKLINILNNNKLQYNTEIGYCEEYSYELDSIRCSNLDELFDVIIGYGESWIYKTNRRILNRRLHFKQGCLIRVDYVLIPFMKTILSNA